MGKYNFDGLSEQDVQKAKEEFGLNELPEIEEETFWEKLWENFEDPLIKILLVALLITFVLAILGYSEWYEAVGIAVAVFLATFVATYSEYKNEASFRKLQAEAAQTTNSVFRNGALQTIGITGIVKGDYVLLQAGDKIPADGPLIAGSVSSNQSSLTGEPLPIRKTADPNLDLSNIPEKPEWNDKCQCFRGSVIEQGEGVMVVQKIGVATVYGKIFEDLENAEERDSPLKVKLTNLADMISTIGYVGATAIFLSFLFKQFVMDQGYSFNNTVSYVTNWSVALQDTVNALILAIIIIVVAVPEGLPMMIAIVLSINMQKLLDRKVLVRKLSGIETAGSLNVLFTDKTGTLTKGILEAHVFVGSDQTSYGQLSKVPTNLAQLLKFTLKHSTQSSVDATGSIIGGNASDKAFLQFINRDGYLQAQEDVETRSEILFSSTHKLSAATIHASKEVLSAYPKTLSHDGKVTLIKGAPEKLIPECVNYYDNNGNLKEMSRHQKESFEDLINKMSSSGIRVIALATSSASLPPDAGLLAATPTLPHRGSKGKASSEFDVESFFVKLNFVGLIGLRDEIRPETPSAIRLCKMAEIQVIMITGDRKETAVAIAQEVGLIDDKLGQNRVLESSDIQNMSDLELQRILPQVAVVSRALPTDKSRLIQIVQKMNKVVGMTGDGVNDAAALNRADVGFGMGSGTEMAKEASDIVIMDDNFNSITTAILYGRTIFRSIRKFIIFQSTINVASTLIVFLGPFLGFDFPLTLIQLLWVNLVMDTLAALAFGGEPALERYMHDKPTQRSESIISPYMWSSFTVGGIFIAFMSICFLISPQVKVLFTRPGADPAQTDAVFLTAFFAFYIFITTVNAFNVRTPHLNIFENLSKNKGFLAVLTLIFFVQIVFTVIGGKLLRTVPLLSDEWLYIIAMSFVIIPLDLVRKLALVPFLPERYLDPEIDNSESSEEDKKEK